MSSATSEYVEFLDGDSFEWGRLMLGAFLDVGPLGLMLFEFARESLKPIHLGQYTLVWWPVQHPPVVS